MKAIRIFLLCPGLGSPRGGHLAFVCCGLSFFCTDFPAKLCASMFDGLYLGNQKPQTADIRRVCCPSGVQQIEPNRSPTSPLMWEGRSHKNRTNLVNFRN